LTIGLHDAPNLIVPNTHSADNVLRNHCFATSIFCGGGGGATISATLSTVAVTAVATFPASLARAWRSPSQSPYSIGGSRQSNPPGALGTAARAAPQIPFYRLAPS
jgi:hypothetical protein